MLDALVGRTIDPTGMAELAQGRMRPKSAALLQALTRHFRAHMRSVLITQILALDATITTLSVRIDTALAPFAEAVQRLDPTFSI